MKQTKLLEQYIRMIVEAEVEQPPEKPKEASMLDFIKGVEDPNDLMRILNQWFGRPLGGGVARVAFPYGKDKVIKVAYGGEVEHNRNEIKNAECLGKHYAVEVYEYDPKFLWVVEERVKKTTSETLTMKFRDLTGEELTTNQIRDLFGGFDYMRRLHFKLLKSNDWYRGLSEKLKDCHVVADDFHENNWGIRESTGELVLLDLGF